MGSGTNLSARSTRQAIACGARDLRHRGARRRQRPTCSIQRAVFSGPSSLVDANEMPSRRALTRATIYDDGRVEYFLIRRSWPDNAKQASRVVAARATPRFTSARVGGGQLFVEGPIFRLEAGEPHAGERAAEKLLARLDTVGKRAFADAVGDFVAAWVRSDGEVLLFKSFTSQYQIYYDAKSASNRLAPLASLREVEFDRSYFDRFALLVPGLSFFDRRTPIRGVQRVRPGEIVRLGARPSAEQVVRRSYGYRFDRHQDRAKAARRLREQIETCVADRLASHAGSVSVELSGGLDSSFVACLVGRARPGARAIMFSRPNIPSHVESERHAKSVARRYGLELQIVTPDALGPARAFEEPTYADEPSDFFWFGDVFSRAIAHRVEPGSLVMTGFGADQLLLRTPAILPHLLGRGRVRDFVRALGPVAKLVKRSRAQLAYESLLSQIPKRAYFSLSQRFENARFNPLSVSEVNLNRALNAPVSWLAAGPEKPAFDDERESLERAIVGGDIVCDDWGYFAAPRAVVASYFDPRAIIDGSPFCDLRLVDFVYDEVSAHLVHDFRGRYKELLREAGRDLLPPALRDRENDMFVFNAFLGEYLESTHDAWSELLDDAPEGWLDRDGARRALDELAFGLMSSSTRSLIAVVGYLVWRRGFVRELARSKERAAHDGHAE